MSRDRARTFPVVGPGSEMEPSYDRVARGLSDAELEDEIVGGKGEAGYQLALLAEADRRGQAPPTEPPRRRPNYDADEWEET